LEGLALHVMAREAIMSLLDYEAIIAWSLLDCDGSSPAPTLQGFGRVGIACDGA